MSMTQYEADTLLMAVRFQMANDQEINEQEWTDLLAIKEKLEALLIFQQIVGE